MSLGHLTETDRNVLNVDALSRYLSHSAWWVALYICISLVFETRLPSWRPRVPSGRLLFTCTLFHHSFLGIDLRGFWYQPMPNRCEMSRACDGSQEKGQYRHRDGKCKDLTGPLHISGNCFQRVWRLVDLHGCIGVASCIQFDRTAIQAVLNAWRLEEVNAQAAAWRPEQQFSKGLSERYLTLNSQHVRLAASHIITCILWSTEQLLWRNRP